MKKAAITSLIIFCLGSVCVHSTYGFLLTDHTLLLYENGRRITDDSVYIYNTPCKNGICIVSASQEMVTFTKIKTEAANATLEKALSSDAVDHYVCEDNDLKAVDLGMRKCSTYNLTYFSDTRHAELANKYADEYRSDILMNVTEYERKIELPKAEFILNKFDMPGGRAIPKTIAVDIGTGEVRVLEVDGVPVREWYQKPMVLTGVLGLLAVAGGLLGFLWKRATKK